MHLSKLLLLLPTILILPASAHLNESQKLDKIRAALRNATTKLQQKSAAKQLTDNTLHKARQAEQQARQNLDQLIKRRRAIQHQIDQLQAEMLRLNQQAAAAQKTLSALLYRYYTQSRQTSLTHLLTPIAAGHKQRYLNYIQHLQAAQKTRIQQLLEQKSSIHTQQTAIQNQSEALYRQQHIQQNTLQQISQKRHAAETQSRQLDSEINAQSRQITLLRADELALQRLLNQLYRRPKTKHTTPSRTPAAPPNTTSLTAQELAAEAPAANNKHFEKTAGKLHRPIQAPISGYFGEHRPGGGSWQGLFFRSEPATVYSIAAGTIVKINQLKGYGQTILIDHNNGYTSVYTGLSQISVRSGSSVSAGSPLGRSGRLKDSENGLYFLLSYQGKLINPQSWLR